jgi:dienelactone hydrolase
VLYPRLFYGAALALAILSVPVAAQTPINDVARTWTAAKVFVRNEPGPKTPAQIAVDKPSPVLIYLHGCGGLNDDNDLPWAEFIAQHGFIVIAPDRFARADRRDSCWPSQIPGILDMRREELTYALQQVKASAWADPANIFVMGFSEGADAVAGATPAGVRASIISSWTCSRVPAIALPASMPVLSIQWDNVPLHLGVLVNSNQACTHKFQDRAGFQRVSLRGKGHASYKEDSAREAVAQFLRDNLVHTAAAN